jgi:hypothetical protein
MGNPLHFTTLMEKKNPQLNVENMSVAEYRELVAQTDKSLQAYLFILNCNAHKWESFVKNLQTRFAPGEEKYPTLLLKAKQMGCQMARSKEEERQQQVVHTAPKFR